jgi:hypothetical protein
MSPQGNNPPYLREAPAATFAPLGDTWDPSFQPMLADVTAPPQQAGFPTWLLYTWAAGMALWWLNKKRRA